MAKGTIIIAEITDELTALREAVELRFGHAVTIPRDFNALANDIFNQKHETIAENTLKRLFGYSGGYETSRRFTLDVLAHYVGRKDWDDFCHNLRDNASSQVFDNDIVNVCSLSPGMRLELRWYPERRVVVEYQGDNNFVVMESVNAKLTVGDTFSCQSFLNNQPLTVTNLLHKNNDHPVNYICGKQGGITVKLI